MSSTPNERQLSGTAVGVKNDLLGITSIQAHGLIGLYCFQIIAKNV